MLVFAINLNNSKYVTRFWMVIFTHLHSNQAKATIEQGQFSGHLWDRSETTIHTHTYSQFDVME